MHMDPKQAHTTIPETERIQLTVQLHIAEYTALTTKATYIQSIQAVFFAALVTGIATMLSNIDSKVPLYKWGFIFGIQGLAIIIAWNMYEHYRIVRYIEQELRQHLLKLKFEKEVWAYETFLYGERKRNKFIAAELLAPLTYLTLIVVCVCFYFPKAYLDWIGYSITIGLFLTYCTIMSKVYNLRKNKWGMLPKVS